MTSNNVKPVVIVGSGLSALMIGRMLRSRLLDETPIIFIEQDAKIGGQFQSFDYLEYGLFDYGMHIFYETCIPAIDELFTTIFEQSEWNILEQNKKDIAGLFVNNKLQANTPYVDLRSLDLNFRKKCISEFFLHVESITKNSQHEYLNKQKTAYGVLINQFGKFIADELFVPIFKKLYQIHPRYLDEIATRLTLTDRIALFDEELSFECMYSEVLKARICYPDQINLPPVRLNNQRGFYPKKYGMINVVNRLQQILQSQNAKFLTSSKIIDLDFKDQNIVSATVNSALHGQFKIEIDRLYWTSGLPSLAKLLGISLDEYSIDANNKESYYVNFLFEAKPNMNGLYYFYCFDAGFRTYRVTDYSSYCPQAVRQQGFPLCVEMWLQSGDCTNMSDIINMAYNELVSFGIVPQNNKVPFARAEKVNVGGFPLPTINNINYIKSAQEKINDLQMLNLKTFGVFSDKNVFFIKDVLKSAYYKLIK